ncbi:MAG: VOC family protein [Saprospiraceae bacterium]
MKLSLFICLLFVLSGCSKDAGNLSLDHVNVWVKDPVKAKKKLEDLGFKAVPDSLSQVHTGQGTTGRYFYFLNTYLELIYIYDEAEFKENINTNQSLDFLERSKSPANGYLPFGVALKMNPYDKTKIPFTTVRYHQDWMGKGNSIYAAQNSKLKKEEPSVFVIYPEIEYEHFENIDSLKRIPEEYSIWRTFYQHENGAENVSKVKIYTDKLDKESSTIKSINAIENVEVITGKEYLMELYFDHQRQKKTYDLRPDLPLIIHL